MNYDHITTERELIDFCRAIESADSIAFDTEFVSEDSYLPELCLIQVAAGDRLAVIDPLEVRDMSPFWDLIATGEKETLVHAGREEFRFCLRAVNRRPTRLFDVQIAAALIGLEYPASYGTLVSKLLGRTLPKGETRTDWRARPLSQRQLEYALHDVHYLAPLRAELHGRLEKMGRLSWLADEIETWQRGVEAFEGGERWMRTSGIAGLSRRQLAVIRSLWHWRDQEASRRNQPPRRVLRDDLLVELAKRQTADPKRIRSLRGMERGDLQKQMPRIVSAIEEALELPDDQLPELDRRPLRSQLNVLGQFLTTALGSICRNAEVAPSIVGTAQDVRDLTAYYLGLSEAGEIPALAQGWRADVVGRVIEDILKGRLTISIADPNADEPLTFEPRREIS